jgi:hypothetical protein
LFKEEVLLIVPGLFCFDKGGLLDIYCASGKPTEYGLFKAAVPRKARFFVLKAFLFVSDLFSCRGGT